MLLLLFREHKYTKKMILSIRTIGIKFFSGTIRSTLVPPFDVYTHKIDFIFFRREIDTLWCYTYKSLLNTLFSRCSFAYLLYVAWEIFLYYYKYYYGQVSARDFGLWFKKKRKGNEEAFSDRSGDSVSLLVTDARPSTCAKTVFRFE